MGLFANSFDIDTLRALAVVRLRLAAGEGLESILTRLHDGDLGKVSQALRAPMRRIRAGQDARRVLQEQLAVHPNRSWRELVGCLLAEGRAAEQRMDELAREIQSARKTTTEQFAKRLDGRLTLFAVLFVLTFAQVFVQIFAAVPDNDILPTISLPPAFVAAFYLVLSTILAVVVLLTRYSE